jgi:uncharacterized membrane protein YccC
LLGQISALEGVRRHLYYDAPRLRSADELVQLLGNQLVLLTARLTALRHQRELLLERLEGEIPQEIQRLLAEEVLFLDELAQLGRAMPVEQRRQFGLLQKRFDDLAYLSEQLVEPLPATLRSLSWSLRWEQARLLQQFETIMELSDVIQSGRKASSVYRGQKNTLHMDYTLAAMNAIRAFCALMVAGLIWIETGWDGARGGMIVAGILCSLMATFPRPLLAAQSYARGLGLALVVSAVLQFALVPMISSFELLALLLAPLLYCVAVGLSSPPTTGTGIGLGLTTFLLLGPQNVGLGQNSAIQWFEFSGAYVCATTLALSVYALIFPFRPVLRIRRLHKENCEQVNALLKIPATDENQFAFESRMVDRLTMMLGLLPSIQDKPARDLFDVSLGCMALGIALNQLRQQGQNNPLLSPDMQNRLFATVRDTGRLVAGRAGIDKDRVLASLHVLGDELDALHCSVHEQLWSVFRMRVALLIVVSFLERHRGHFEPAIPTEGVPALAH